VQILSHGKILFNFYKEKHLFGQILYLFLDKVLFLFFVFFRFLLLPCFHPRWHQNVRLSDLSVVGEDWDSLVSVLVKILQRNRTNKLE
jgi:hypothetical protein